jgi:hypothetical protein
MNNIFGYSNSDWYLKSINKINIVEMDNDLNRHQIRFTVKFDKQLIVLNRLYPTYPEISGFEILQFISHLAFQCQFSIEVNDASDISKVYFALYDKSYYSYHLKGVDLSQDFIFKKIVIKKKTFLNCFKEMIKSHLHFEIKSLFESLPLLFYENIKACEKPPFVSLEFCPITFDTQRIFYEKSFEYCIDWSPFGGFPRKIMPFPRHFKIFVEDMTRIMTKPKNKSNNISFVKLNRHRESIKTYDQIKTEIFDTSFLSKFFSNIFEFCFVQLEKQTFYPNPEDIFKLYLRPCVMPKINQLLKY